MNRRAKSNSIRIIAGQWRGRKLPVLDSQGLRPTTDRVRETLFNWLMYELQGARCLDLYAGTGALGLESLSRGAKYVQFVELSASVASAIKQNLHSLKVPEEGAHVAINSANVFLNKPPTEPFDVIFLDPPFDKGLLPEVIQRLAEPGWLSERAFVYVEQGVKEPELEVPLEWSLHRHSKAGQSRYCVYSINAV